MTKGIEVKGDMAAWVFISISLHIPFFPRPHVFSFPCVQHSTFFAALFFQTWILLVLSSPFMFVTQLH